MLPGVATAARNAPGARQGRGEPWREGRAQYSRMRTEVRAENIINRCGCQLVESPVIRQAVKESGLNDPEISQGPPRAV